MRCNFSFDFFNDLEMHKIVLAHLQKQVVGLVGPQTIVCPYNDLKDMCSLQRGLLVSK